MLVRRLKFKDILVLLNFNTALLYWLPLNWEKGLVRVFNLWVGFLLISYLLELWHLLLMVPSFNDSFDLGVHELVINIRFLNLLLYLILLVGFKFLIFFIFDAQDGVFCGRVLNFGNSARSYLWKLDNFSLRIFGMGWNAFGLAAKDIHKVSMLFTSIHLNMHCIFRFFFFLSVYPPIIHLFFFKIQL